MMNAKPPSVLDRAYALVGEGRAAEALAITTPLVQAAAPTHGALAAHSVALKAAGRAEEALRFDDRASRAFPNSGIAWHNLAATLGDLGRAAQAKAAAERAFALGLNAPETWLTYARAHVVLNDMTGAERAYREALRRRPGYTDAALALARLIWVQTGDPAQAIAPLRAAAAAGGDETLIVFVQGKILEASGQRDAQRALYDDVLRRRPNDVSILRAAAEASLVAGEDERATALAERAVVASPAFIPGLVQLTAVYLAQGRAQEALAVARRATEVAPMDQSTWGWVATAARAAGDPAYQALYDYAAFVRPYRLQPPEGWSTLDAFLSDLAEALRGIHVFKVEPADQSLRLGTQTGADLQTFDHPVIQAFFKAVQQPIAEYAAALGTGPDPLRSRNTGRPRIDSAWSVLLKPNGYHADHFHPHGWLSSAFYVEVPTAALDTDAREGWIKFGQPPFRTLPPMPPEHYVRPEPGTLVLFPSYMWHGTVPFTTPESRMTIAFDVVPDIPA